MIIGFQGFGGQARKPVRGIPCLVLGLFLFLVGCTDPPVTPPDTPLLARRILGYGVVKASYTRVMDEPSAGAVALGYIRERTILEVLERRLVKDGEHSAYWFLTEGTYRGWLPEAAVDLYDNEGKARTAAESP
ncbi:MAG: hypothetical protein LBD31_09730 [Treponema sp.]|jgi:hypothetical protein|nr:hypothetical protein [Treponema sp.]